MKRLWLLPLVIVVACGSKTAVDDEVALWQEQSRRVTIIRDDLGVPHIYGKTDADTVFGTMYAQAEDDFNRVETNYINAMGRLAEAEGEDAIFRDLRMKLFIDPEETKARYESSPAWLKGLLEAYAAGLNYYLHTHPEVTPRVIKRFEPWMALTFTEGSIGGDIERINLGELEAFYGGKAATPAASAGGGYIEPAGSNGIAIAPSNTAMGQALFLINPHTSFFFRAELQMVSEEGMNAYGAVTWGQFFIYQGFNERLGWMHTSSGVDNIDEYLETVIRKEDGYYYKYDGQERPLIATRITVPYKQGTGIAQREFTVYRTHHGPVVREADGKWITVRLMQEPVNALIQSYTRTKAKTYEQFLETMELHTNSSNNTVYADGDGNIAYFHSNFIPRRDTRFDWTAPVDGSDPATEWDGVLSIEETPGVFNPASGWVYNTNNGPWSAAGPDSPKREDFPAYVERGGENGRGIHAVRLLQDKKDFTLDTLMAAAYDTHLPEFDSLIPALLNTWDHAADDDPLRKRLSEPIGELRGWDLRWSVSSIATTLAVYWGEEISRIVGTEARRAGLSVGDYIATRARPRQLLETLSEVCEKLTGDFGTWKTPWGEINRFQRLTGDIVQPFSDTEPSIPVGFTSGRWGSLASFGSRTYTGTKKRYGTSGNSFVAVVEFGERVRAKAITAGGQSGNPASPHFNDQAERYSTGDLRAVYFYRSELDGHIEREYRPGR